MDPLFAFQAVGCHVIGGAECGEIWPHVRGLRHPQLAPRPITQIEHAVLVFHSVRQRVRPLERVVVVLQYDIDVVAFKEWRPVQSLFLTGSKLPFGTGWDADGGISRHVIGHDQMGPRLSVGQGLGEPVGLLARDGGDMP